METKQQSSTLHTDTVHCGLFSIALTFLASCYSGKMQIELEKLSIGHCTLHRQMSTFLRVINMQYDKFVQCRAVQ